MNNFELRIKKLNSVIDNIDNEKITLFLNLILVKLLQVNKNTEIF